MNLQKRLKISDSVIEAINGVISTESKLDQTSTTLAEEKEKSSKEVDEYLSKGGKVAVGKTRTAKGVSYLRNRSRQLGSSKTAKTVYKEGYVKTSQIVDDAHEAMKVAHNAPDRATGALKKLIDRGDEHSTAYSQSAAVHIHNTRKHLASGNIEAARDSWQKAHSALKEDVELQEARKLEGTYEHEGHTTKVYKLSGEHNEGDDYHVKLFKNGKHYEPADYFTNDKEDAHGTAKHMVKNPGKINESDDKENPNLDYYHSLPRSGGLIKPDSFYKERREKALNGPDVKVPLSMVRYHTADNTHEVVNTHVNITKPEHKLDLIPDGIRYGWSIGHNHPDVDKLKEKGWHDVQLYHRTEGSYEHLENKPKIFHHDNVDQALKGEAGKPLRHWYDNYKSAFAKEEVEQVNEISKKALVNYMGSAGINKTDKAIQLGFEASRVNADNEETRDRLRKKIGNRGVGMNRATLKLAGMARVPVKEAAELNTSNAEKARVHDCAKHVVHEQWGKGDTITTMHAEPDENGNIAWYDVMFEHGIEHQVPTSNLTILFSEMHSHKMNKKKKMQEQEEHSKEKKKIKNKIIFNPELPKEK